MRLKKIETYEDCIIFTFKNDSKNIHAFLWEDGKEIEILPEEGQEDLMIVIDKKQKVRTCVLRIYEKETLIYRRRIILGKGQKRGQSIWNQKISVDFTYSNRDISERANTSFH